MTENRLKIGFALLLLLAGIGGAWAIIALRPQVVTQTPKVDIPSVTVVTVTPQTIKLSIHTQGVVTPRNEIDVIPEVPGKVIYLHPQFVAGGFFNHDERLVSIDSRDYDVAIEQAQAQIAEAKRLLAMEDAQADQARNEWQALGEGTPSALVMREPQLAEAKAKLKSAEAGLAMAKLKRSRCELRAPFTGRLQSKTIGLGQFIQPGDKIARIFSTDVVEVRLPISTEQLGFLDLPLSTVSDRRQAPEVNISADFAGALHTWQGRIVRTEGALDESTGVLYVVAEVMAPYRQKNKYLPLLSHLFVQADISGKTVDHIFELPLSAMTASQEVLLVDNQQKLHIQRVEVLRTEPDRILVNAGLNSGDRLITSSIDVPIEGMKVNIAEDKATDHSTAEPR